MKKLITSAACGFVLAAVPVLAQSPRAPQRAATTKHELSEKESLPAKSSSLSEMSPEMWLYTQEMRRRDDPKEAVRRKAEFRAAQRQRRIAAREWFGYSNSRPRANLDPWNTSNSPHWTANNALHPDQWVGNNRTSVRR